MGGGEEGLFRQEEKVNGKASRKVLLARGFGEFLDEH